MNDQSPQQLSSAYGLPLGYGFNFDQAEVEFQLCHLLNFHLAKTPQSASTQDWLHALTLLIRGYVFHNHNQTKYLEKQQPTKFVNYLSMEFLIGRMLQKSIAALGLSDTIKQVLKKRGLSFADLEEAEPEPGLGNGGLGRLAACFMDSMATLGMPAFGYGIRYDYGMFKQKIVNGEQVEVPDMWLLNDYLWEIHHPEISYSIPFGGTLATDEKGQQILQDSYSINAQAYDVLVPGYDSANSARIRLWSATTTDELALDYFNAGDSNRAFYGKNYAQSITSVLYPDDSSEAGKILRLRQEYFFVSASIQDIIFRYTTNHQGFSTIAKYQAIHLNDTHPALAIPEFMRVLTEVYALPWDQAWGYCQQTFSYTNHTLLPEAFESWKVSYIELIIPQVLKIIYRLNEDFLNALRGQAAYDDGFLSRVSLINEAGDKSVRMANLAVIASHKINGVSKLHGQLMIEHLFADFYRLFPERFISITNGVTPRRWIKHANPRLTRLLDQKIGSSWHQDLTELKRLKEFADDQTLQADFQQVKLQNKQALADYLQLKLRCNLDPHSLFDVQIKRMHEYKRQLLNVFHVIDRYNQIIAKPELNWVPRTVIIGGKAASAYYMAKLIIRFIHDVAQIINQDKRTKHLLQLIFVPNYSVKMAELLIPAADLSEQISTAGFEASGTGNMKLSMNGALTIGTYDGANIEIIDAVGADNFFLFGNRAEAVKKLNRDGYRPLSFYEQNSRIKRLIDQIRQGFFSPLEPERYDELVQAVLHSDYYQVLADFSAYLTAQQAVDELFVNPSAWQRKAILNVAAMGVFSSDRTIIEYAKSVWQVPVKLPSSQ